MEEIKVGEYIRNYQGNIYKIINKRKKVDFSLYETDKNGIISNIVLTEETKKHSKNIIDLIEVGDYVNNCKVLEKIGKFVQVSTSDYGNSRFFEWQIKTILTHEQYEENCFKVVE